MLSESASERRTLNDLSNRVLRSIMLDGFDEVRSFLETRRRAARSSNHLSLKARAAAPRRACACAHRGVARSPPRQRGDAPRALKTKRRLSGDASWPSRQAARVEKPFLGFEVFRLVFVSCDARCCRSQCRPPISAALGARRNDATATARQQLVYDGDGDGSSDADDSEDDPSDDSRAAKLRRRRRGAAALSARARSISDEFARTYALSDDDYDVAALYLE